MSEIFIGIVEHGRGKKCVTTLGNLLAKMFAYIHQDQSIVHIL